SLFDQQLRTQMQFIRDFAPDRRSHSHGSSMSAGKEMSASPHALPDTREELRQGLRPRRSSNGKLLVIPRMTKELAILTEEEARSDDAGNGEEASDMEFSGTPQLGEVLAQSFQSSDLGLEIPWRAQVTPPISPGPPPLSPGGMLSRRISRGSEASDKSSSWGPTPSMIKSLKAR
ncbi:unnamed protein product, partial [Polarella glacialis]